MKNTLVQPYLFFGGRCDEALEFYRTALGAQVEFLMRYQDSPEPMPTFRIGEATLMASDGCAAGAKFDGFSLSLAVTTTAEANRAFAALAAGGQVKMPLTKTFWSPCFGMVTDRFGIAWMVSVPA